MGVFEGSVACREAETTLGKEPRWVEEGKDLPPHEYYKRKDAERALEDARFVVGIIKRLIAAKNVGQLRRKSAKRWSGAKEIRKWRELRK